MVSMVGQNHTYIRIYGVYTVFLAGRLPYIQSYTVHIYGSGQPYSYAMFGDEGSGGHGVSDLFGKCCASAQ